MIDQQILAGDLEGALAARLAAWRETDAVGRLWRRDHTLWSEEPVPELEDRLGWLGLPETMAARCDVLRRFAAAAAGEGIGRVLLLGMGGSSLAPDVFARTFAGAPGFPGLVVVDTTHPDAVRAVDRAADPERTLVLVASKSGTTVETLSLFRHFWERLAALPERGRRFAAVTDPGTPLETLARERGFREVFSAPPDVGGRFSALSVFGLLPAALIGVDPARLLASARAASAACRDPEGDAVALGALLGEAARAGRDKLTLFTSPHLGAFPAWIEQLVAESTGKRGRGILPVAGEPPQPTALYGRDRLFVSLALAGERERPLEELLDALAAAGHPVMRIRLDEPADLGGEMFRWETAVALAGSVLGINPFDQPDVQLAKDLARRAMAGEAASVPSGVAADAAGLADAVAARLASVAAGDYVAVQAFLAPEPETDARLARLRSRLLAALRVPVTVGYGPRFLHSTGQLHKGGPDRGVFLQLVDNPRRDLPIPGSDHTFGQLIRAQADGDLAALQARGRRILRVDLGADPQAGLARLAEAVTRG